MLARFSGAGQFVRALRDAVRSLTTEHPPSATASAQPMPVAATNRIVSIDVLRGMALLGILLMNVQSFAMPSDAYLNPTAYGDLTGMNRLVWIVTHLLADQ